MKPDQQQLADALAAALELNFKRKQIIFHQQELLKAYADKLERLSSVAKTLDDTVTVFEQGLDAGEYLEFVSSGGKDLLEFARAKGYNV